MISNARSENKIWRVIDILNWGEKYFSDSDFENPRKEIELLLQSILKCIRVDLYLRFEEPLTQEHLNTLKYWIKRRKEHEPSQYITGKTGFYNIEINIEPGVLIPRPETELIIDKTLEFYPKESNISILDIGTGSGCIALALAKELPQADVLGIDISKKAVDLAKANAESLKIENAKFEELDILKVSPNSKFDLVVSNPPYVPKNEMDRLMSEVKDFEPHSALTDFNDGLTFYRKFIDLSGKILKPGGRFLVEVGIGEQVKKVQELFTNAAFKNIEIFNDYNGDERVILADLK